MPFVVAIVFGQVIKMKTQLEDKLKLWKMRIAFLE
jgi:hypothetical protein